MTFVAIEYKKDSGHAYWGTPLVPTSFAGSHAVNGVVSGNAISTFSGDNLGPMTIDLRTLTTNYNVADNATGAQELWLRSGFEWTPLNNVTVKDQVYYYQATAQLARQRNLCLRRRRGIRVRHHRPRSFLRDAQSARGRQQSRLLVGFAAVRHGQSPRRPTPGERKLDHVRGGGQSQ